MFIFVHQAIISILKNVLRLLKFSCNNILDTERPIRCPVMISSSKLYMMQCNHHVFFLNKFFFVFLKCQ